MAMARDRVSTWDIKIPPTNLLLGIDLSDADNIDGKSQLNLPRQLADIVSILNRLHIGCGRGCTAHESLRRGVMGRLGRLGSEL